MTIAPKVTVHPDVTGHTPICPKISDKKTAKLLSIPAI